ncbi:hypothetical protein C8R43DRAFT_886991 [Mycena crocata]|nr:hypothetical protein C8R43DRAFT_886991 [Mycena crocata]
MPTENVQKPSLRLQNYGNTHLNGYFRSLLVANALQAFGTVLNFRWVVERGVTNGPFCSAQGGIKQAGNVATALWSLALAMHLFNMLFLRLKSSMVAFWGTIVAGWSIVVFIVLIGPTVIETSERGPYFGVSGAWCWITNKYPKEQIFLEYFLEYVTAGICLILYTIIVLRMRGNLVHQDGKWSLRLLPPGESWQLSIRRDIIDSAMLQIVYICLILPITLARLSQFAGANVPFWATIVTAVIFNLTGFVNVILLAATRKIFPDARELPEFSTARQKMRKSLFAAGGVTPFTIDHSDPAEAFNIQRLARAESARSSRSSSVSSIDSTEKPAQ